MRRLEHQLKSKSDEELKKFAERNPQLETFVEEIIAERSKVDLTPIFTITTIRHSLDAGSRAVGYAHKFENADRWVRENALNINECGYYPFCVIEPVVQGIYCHPRKEHWYKFNQKKDEYEPCDKPDRFKQVIGWSLG